MQDLRPRAYTIIELMTSMAILSVLVVMIFSALGHSTSVWRQAGAKMSSFQNARAAFEMMNRRVSQATLNTYWDYYNAGFQPFRLSPSNTVFIPRYYGRYSDLHFVSGPAGSLIPTLPPKCSATATHALFFTAPTGLTTNSNYHAMPELLGACGYFIAFGGDDAFRPSIVTGTVSYRWRLMELAAPVESLSVFASSTGQDWLATPVKEGRARPVADNIIALIVWPRMAPLNDPAGTRIAPNYTYDTRAGGVWPGNRQPVQSHQLPPSVQVTMVAIDEAAAVRMANGSLPPAVITEALAGRFTGAVTSFGADLQLVEEALIKNRITYNVFTTTIALREAQRSQ